MAETHPTVPVDIAAIRSAIATCEGDVELAADLCGAPLAAVWDVVLTDPELPDLMKKVATVRAHLTWANIRTELDQKISDMEAHSLAKFYLDFGRLFEKPTVVLQQNNQQNNFGGVEDADVLVRLAQRLGVAELPDGRA